MQTLNELITVIESKITLVDSVADLASTLKSYHGMDWRGSEKYDPEQYQRVTLHSCPDFELRLICWSPAQASGCHDHPEKGCCMLMLSGELTEELYDSEDRKNIIKSTRLSAGNLGYIDNEKGHHSIINSSNQTAASLHLYAPGGYEPRFYS